MAHMHDDPVVRRETHVIDDGTGAGFGAGMMLAVLAIVAAVVIGLALLWTQPWDDDGGGTTGVPDVQDTVPNVPDTNGGTDGGSTGGGTDGGTDGGSGAQPSQ